MFEKGVAKAGFELLEFGIEQGFVEIIEIYGLDGFLEKQHGLMVLESNGSGFFYVNGNFTGEARKTNMGIFFGKAG